MQLRLATYNIHKGIGGVDRRYLPERIVEVIAHYRPDIVLLQEVDDGVPRSRCDKQVDLLGDELGYRYRAFQQNVGLKKGGYGNAILSRFPIHEQRSINLTIPFKKCRRALLTKCVMSHDGHQRTIAVVCTHLGLAGFERRIQLRRLITHPRIHRIHVDTPVIIGGDFNDIWSSLGAQVMRPAGYWAAHGPMGTFPARLPVRSLDAFYCRGPLSVEAAFVGRVRTALHASDHRPVIVDLRCDDPIT